MTRTIGIGVIGMGWMGEVHSRSYRTLSDRFPDAEVQPRLVVCADGVAHRAEACRQRFGFERSTTDWRAVVDDPDVEVVNIAAPNSMHLELVTAAAAAGKHVMCEKPVGKDPDETIAAVAAARDAGVRTLVGYNYRWAPLVQHARRLVASGELGQVTHYHGRFLNGYAGDPNGVLSWRFDRAQGLGTLSDLMVHAIDMAHMLAGPIARVTSTSETFITQRPLPVPGEGTHYDIGGPDDPQGPVSNEDYVSALVHFASGARGTLEACRVITGAACDMSFEVHGTRGALKWSFERMNELQVHRRGPDPAAEGWTTLLSGPAHPFHRRFNPGWGVGLGYDDLKVIEAHTLLESVASGVQAEPGIDEALAVARVQQAMLRSWDSQAWEPVEHTDRS